MLVEPNDFSLYLRSICVGRTVAFIFPRWRQTRSCMAEIPTFIPFPDPWGDKHVAWADVDTPGNYPATFPPSRSWLSKQPGHQGRSFTDMTLSRNLLVITLFFFYFSLCYFIYQECSGKTEYRSFVSAVCESAEEWRTATTKEPSPAAVSLRGHFTSHAAFDSSSPVLETQLRDMGHELQPLYAEEIGYFPISVLSWM